VRIGIALPQFVEDPEIPIAAAVAAEAAGIDGVFVYDHLWRGEPPNRRPALECFALLGALAAETARVSLGTLVARATLRPAATTANAFATAQRVSEGRVIAGLGAGDGQSRAENEAYGLPFGTLAERLDRLHETVVATRAHGVPVWIGGTAERVAPLVAGADGWNGWGLEPEALAAAGGIVRAAAPAAALTWGGVARPREDGVAALADRLARYAEVGCAWAVLAAADPLDPANAEIVGEARRRLA